MIISFLFFIFLWLWRYALIEVFVDRFLFYEDIYTWRLFLSGENSGQNVGNQEKNGEIVQVDEKIL